jgi:hypothetical protein
MSTTIAHAGQEYILNANHHAMTLETIHIQTHIHWSSVSVTTTAKEKTTPNLLPRPFLIGQNHSFSASPLLFKEKEVCHTTFTMSSRGNKGRK